MRYSYDEMKNIFNWNHTHETQFEKLSPIRQKMVLEGKFTNSPKNGVSIPTGKINYRPFVIFGAGILVGMLLRKR